MEYRPLGRTGVMVSQYCLGTMMFGRATGEDESIPMIQYALDHDVNFIDTADAYSRGESERIVGKALSDSGRRESTILATKVFFSMDKDDPNARGLSRRHIVQACEDSLRRLRTDWIDLYQLHRSQANIPIDDTLRALDDLIRAGKVRYIGCSMFPAWKTVESLWAAEKYSLHRFISDQSVYNLLDRTLEREVIPAARTYGIAVIPWGPLCGGLLTGKYRRDDMSAAGRWQGGADNMNRTPTPTAFDVIERVVELAERKGCSPSQLALAWTAAQPGITAPIIGPRTMEQVVDNLGAADVELRSEDLAELDEVAPPLSSSMRYYEQAMAVDFAPNQYRW